jgi:hypothetical protein
MEGKKNGRLQVSNAAHMIPPRDHVVEQDSPKSSEVQNYSNEWLLAFWLGRESEPGWIWCFHHLHAIMYISTIKLTV